MEAGVRRRDLLNEEEAGSHSHQEKLPSASGLPAAQRWHPVPECLGRTWAPGLPVLSQAGPAAAAGWKGKSWRPDAGGPAPPLCRSSQQRAPCSPRP